MEPILVPYVRNRGEWSISEGMMILIYLHMVNHGLDKDVFKGGEITDEDSWMRFVQSRANVVHVIKSNNNFPCDLIAWLNGWGFNYAWGHFCCMPHTWGKSSHDIGNMTVNYWFNDLKTDTWRLDAILGRVPSTNKKAIEYVTGLGFRRLGEIKSIRYKADQDAHGATLFVKER